MDNDSFGNVMADLNGAMKADDGRSGWQFARMNPRVYEMLAKLDLAPNIGEPPKRKRGKPRKSPQ